MRDKSLPLSDLTIGFIGLGFMGTPMARNLSAAGAKLVIHNRSQGPIKTLAAEGMIVSKTPAELADQVDIIILMLTDTAAVESVIIGKDGLLKRLNSKSLIIDMGTTLMTTTKKLAEKVVKLGGSYIDAPVSGGTIGAETGTLTIMAGGNKEAVARAKPIFDVIGSKTTHVGTVGAGQVAKAANQIIVGLTIGAIAEGLSLARAAGIDASKVREALEGGFADSRILQVHGQRMLDREFAPGAKSTIQHKDMDQAINLAMSLGLELPATTLNRELYGKLITDGCGQLDHAALILAIDPGAI